MGMKSNTLLNNEEGRETDREKGPALRSESAHTSIWVYCLSVWVRSSDSFRENSKIDLCKCLSTPSRAEETTERVSKEQQQIAAPMNQKVVSKKKK